MLFCLMYVRQKKNASGKICFQVIDKSSWNCRIAHTDRSSKNQNVIKRFVKKLKHWIKEKQSAIEIDFNDDLSVYEQLTEPISGLKMERLDLFN